MPGRILAPLLCLFTLVEVNYPLLAPHAELALFAMAGLVLCFLGRPIHPRLAGQPVFRALDVGLAALAVGCCGWVFVQSEPRFESLWLGGASLGNRAGQEAPIDGLVGIVGLVLIVEATRRAIGWALPILALAFLAYARFGAWLPDALFPHRGYALERIVAQTFLHGQGVFGTALRVMFVYVFLFIVFGAVLERTGATRFVIDLAKRALGRTAGGPAKVSVLSSGMMGSLSGSAVANTVTTGTFTIPLMRSIGFRPEVAAGVEAAASSGGALMPPVMGAGAYMMLEIISPPVTYLEIIRAALIPALLYYFSLFLIVHFRAKLIGAAAAMPDEPAAKPRFFEGLIFASSLGALVLLLLSGFTVFRAASIALVAALAISALVPRTRLGGRDLLGSAVDSARNAVPLVCAAACVGIVIGVVTLTGIGTRLPGAILGLAQDNLIAALLLIMVSSLILGMGLPSAVCYLLMATLVGPVLGQLGVVPLAAHLFIFYFGMMSMVTPPVALAAYAAASIAGASIMKSGFAAFRFALVGFTLPYLFVFRPELLMLDDAGRPAGWVAIAGALAIAVLGILPFAAAVAGQLFAPLSAASRAALFAAAGLLLWPASRFSLGGAEVSPLDLAGLTLLLLVASLNWRSRAPRPARIES